MVTDLNYYYYYYCIFINDKGKQNIRSDKGKVK